MNVRGSKNAVEHIGPQQLQKLLASESPPLLIDVRDQWEYDIAHLEGAWLLPLGEFEVHVVDVPRDPSLQSLTLVVVFFFMAGLLLHH